MSKEKTVSQERSFINQPTASATDHDIAQLMHADRHLGTEANAIHSPIHVSAHYAFNDAQGIIDAFTTKPGFAYSRQATPTVASLENKINILEKGLGSLCFGSGMAAIAGVMLSLLKAGDHLIASRYIFGNTRSLFDTLQDLGIHITLVDTTAVGNVKQAKQANTRMVFTETIGNPATHISDLSAIGQWCREQSLIYFVDMTMVTPYLLIGKAIHASLVMHSLSKSLCGHGNVIGGSITDTGLFDWSGYPNIVDGYKSNPVEKWGLVQIKKKALRDMGFTLSSEVANRIAIGAETLALRMEKANANALALAHYMEKSGIFSAVHYPGLTSHAQHDAARKLFQDRGYGTLIAAELKENIDLHQFLNAFKQIIIATHLGDNRTLCLPVSPTIYADIDEQERLSMGVSNGLLRFSVGIEPVEDLIADIEQAYNKGLE